MKQLKKGGALLAVVVFLLTALVPAALASGAQPSIIVSAVAPQPNSWELGSSDPLPVMSISSKASDGGDVSKLTYQWYVTDTYWYASDGSLIKNPEGTAIPGAISATLDLANYRSVLGNTAGVKYFYCDIQAPAGTTVIGNQPPLPFTVTVRGPSLVALTAPVRVDPTTQSGTVTLKWTEALRSNLLNASCSATWTCTSATEPGTVQSAPKITTTATQITAESVSGTVSNIPSLRTQATYNYDLTVTLADSITVTEKNIQLAVTPVVTATPQLSNPATWTGSRGVEMETADGGATYYAAVSQNAFPVEAGQRHSAGVQLSTTAITLQPNQSTQYFSVSTATGFTGWLIIDPKTPVGVYQVAVQSAADANARATATISVQGALTATGPTNVSNGKGTLEATLTDALGRTLPTSVTWNWKASNDTIKVTPDASTGTKASASVETVSERGSATVTVQPFIAGTPVAPAATVNVSLENVPKPALNGISVYAMPDTENALPATTSLVCDGKQYQLTAAWGTTAPTSGWTYAWSVARAEGATGTGTAPSLTPSTTIPSVWFIPNVNNVGTWVVQVKGTGTSGDTVEASATLRIERATVQPTITSYQPLQTSLYAAPGEQLNFAITPEAGTDAQGNAIEPNVYWKQTTEGEVTITTVPAPTYTCEMPRSGDLEILGYVAAPGWEPSENADLTGKPTVTWTIKPANPAPVITGALDIVPYDGIIVTDANTRTPAARLCIGGYATFNVAMSAANDPDDFTFVWETRADANASWQPAASFAGMSGQSYTTPLMGLDMDGTQYRVRITNSDDDSLEDISSPVTLVVDSSELRPQVSISSTQPRLNTYNDPPVVTAEAGRDITMTASIDLPYGVPYELQWWRANALAEGEADYTWQEINGQTGETYTLHNVRTADDGDLYRCVATVDYSSGLTGESNSIRVHVVEEPGWVTIDSILINDEPDSLFVYAPNDPPTLRVTAAAEDGGNLSYQWYMNRSDTGNRKIEGATSATYTPNNLEPAATYLMWCEVANVNAPSLEPVASNNVTVVYPSASPKPIITQQPAARFDATPGETVSISVAAQAESGDVLTYSWQSAPWQSDNWSAIALGDAATLRLENVPLSYNGRQYRCVVTNQRTSDSVTSQVCTLFVFDSTAYLRIASQPPEETIAELPILANRSISAGVQVNASQDLSKYKYAWQYSTTQDGAYTDTGVVGALASLPATSTREGDYVISVPLVLLPGGEPLASGFYRLVITNENSSTQGLYATSMSDSAFVLVAEPNTPYITRQPANQSVSQGTTAAFSVSASVANGRPVYRWQKWAYGSTTQSVDTAAPSPGLIGYWMNCNGSDGSGVNTNSFTTVSATPEMRLANYHGEPIYYRCLVYDNESGKVTASRAASLTVTQEVPEEPTLQPAASSPLSIITDNGAQYVTGLLATTAGTKVKDVIDDMRPPRRGIIVILDKDRKVKENDAIVCTGDIMEIRYDDNTVADSATIIVAGDVMGTGVINLTQLTRMATALRNDPPLTGPYLIAGDFTHTGSISLTDLVREVAIFRGTPLPTPTPSPSPTSEPTDAPITTPEPTTSPSGSPTATTTPRPSGSPTASATPRPSGSSTPRPSGSPTASTMPTPSASATPTSSASATSTRPVRPTSSATATASPSGSASARPSATTTRPVKPDQG